MGYSTTLYAVDLDQLKSAVGSGDARLVRRLLPSRKAKGRKKGPTYGPRVWLTRKKEILLNGRRVSWDQLVAELSRPKWKGSHLYLREDGPWRGELADDIEEACRRGRAPWFPYVHYGADEEEWAGEEDELPAEQAAAELVGGKVTRPKEGHQYGYGLEKLCELLGTLLTAVEGKGGMLKALQLHTPLSKERSPVPLPKRRDDFPGIGYLTAAEVRREIDRLRALDLSFPDDDEIEADRQELLRALHKAARKRVGVVAFYY
jgi:hypothetical protein